MAFKGVFRSADKGINPDKFPKPPTIREMVEDIEVSSQDDPVVTFAEVLLKKGNGELLEDTAPAMTTEEEDFSILNVFQKDTSISDWLIDSLAIATIRETKTKLLYSSPKNPGIGSMGKESIATTSESTDFHSKLKQISTICMKSEERIAKVDVHLKELEAKCQDILSDFELTNENSRLT